MWPCTSQELMAYRLFGGIADKRKLLKDEADEPLSEILERQARRRSVRSRERSRAASCCWSCRPAESPPSVMPEPGPGLPETFNGAASPDNSAQLGIEEFYNDRMLTCLIDQALVDNRELKILNEDVQIAGNEVLARSGAYLPFISVGAGAGLNRFSRFTLDGAGVLNDPYLPGKFFQPRAREFRDGLQPHLAAGHLPAVAERPGRGGRSATSSPASGGTTS